MISGDSARLLTLAKGEPNPELRADAVSQLGPNVAITLLTRTLLGDLQAMRRTLTRFMPSPSESAASSV